MAGLGKGIQRRSQLMAAAIAPSQQKRVIAGLLVRASGVRSWHWTSLRAGTLVVCTARISGILVAGIAVLLRTHVHGAPDRIRSHVLVVLWDDGDIYLVAYLTFLVQGGSHFWYHFHTQRRATNRWAFTVISHRFVALFWSILWSISGSHLWRASKGRPLSVVWMVGAPHHHSHCTGAAFVCAHSAHRYVGMYLCSVRFLSHPMHTHLLTDRGACTAALPANVEGGGKLQ